MSILPVANSQLGKPKDTSPGTIESKPQPSKKKRPNFAQIHSKPLPLEIHPLPAFHPSNPISLLQLAYTWISHIIFPPTSHPAENYIGYFSPETRSIHIPNPAHARALWEMGFFGKGTLSRSEPSWLEREKARLRREKYGASGRRAAEDATRSRREERRMFKLERARVERERIDRQRRVEEEGLESGGLDVLGDGTAQLDPLAPRSFTEVSTLENSHEEGEASTQAQNGSIDTKTEDRTDTDTADSVEAQDGSIEGPNHRHGRVSDADLLQATDSQTQLIDPSSEAAKQTTSTEGPSLDEEEPDPDIEDQEHLQLTFEEAFFLTYGLGVLSIFPPPLPDSPPASPKSTPEPYTTHQLLYLFGKYSAFPHDPLFDTLAPDDQFLLNYVTYHHFRSLGWVVRPGLKFGCDYLLYNRGPVFSHAEFAVLIMPAYTDRYWNTPGGRSRRRVEEQKDWWWLHCVNRVQSQVKKTLVLCYVDVPSPLNLVLDFDADAEGDVDVGVLLRSYRVREFVVRRWLANRSRD